MDKFRSIRNGKLLEVLRLESHSKGSLLNVSQTCMIQAQATEVVESKRYFIDNSGNVT
jgi:hypothetical protein